MKTLLLLIVFTLPIGLISSPIEGGFSNIEGFFINYNLGKKKIKFSGGVGWDMNIYNQGHLINLHGSCFKPLFHSRKNTEKHLDLRMKIVVWNLENKSNVFSAVTLVPEFNFVFPLKKKYLLNLFCGYSYTSVFRYKRKSYYEIGWPFEWLPQFGVAFKFL